MPHLRSAHDYTSFSGKGAIEEYTVWRLSESGRERTMNEVLGERLRSPTFHGG
jgi:hypothetical protein